MGLLEAETVLSILGGSTSQSEIGCTVHFKFWKRLDQLLISCSSLLLKIHPVLHVSLLKKAITSDVVEGSLPQELELDLQDQFVPQSIQATCSITGHAHRRPNEQNLFGIVQGGLDPVLRDICVRGLMDRNLPGYAIGGLAGGEDKDSFWRVVAQCTAALPEDKPRYVMGVGYPLDIVVCSALGADMYDCVYPTRTARFGTALVPEGVLKLKHNAMANDTCPIDPTCGCMVCKNYTRAYIHCLVTKDAMGSQLLSYHNLYYMMKLSRDLHSSIVEERFPEFVCDFLQKMFPKGDVPEWVCNAMEVAGIDISSCCSPFHQVRQVAGMDLLKAGLIDQD
ncbi:uncharacterized protein [Euphorbia lathyris]|uniref:uncharacterized protein isoform X8 n=1 Tax=Euphorbia lathyris TaxID=212925 RepID=UPI003313874C